MNRVIKNQHEELNRKVIAGSASGVTGMTMLLILLFLLPILFGDGGNSNEHGGGGLGTADAGGGRAAEGEVGQGTSEVTEVVDEGGSDEEATSTEEESNTGAGDTQMASRQEQRPPPREARPGGLSAFTIASIPEPEENRSRASAASAGFDDVDDRLRDAGAQTGDIQVSLAWNNVNDIDLHVLTPSGQRIYFNNRQSSDGGELDVDMNAGGQRSTKPVENVFWATNTAPKGNYTVQVHHYANHGGRDPTRFQVIVKANGRTRRFEGAVRAGDQIKTIHKFTI